MGATASAAVVTTASGRVLARPASQPQPATGEVRNHGHGMPANHAASMASPEVRAFLGTLTEGDRLDDASGEGRWTVVALHDVRFGAVPVILSDERGHRFQVDLLRREADGSDGAVAYVGDVALYLANRGDGDTLTHEDHGLAVMALARRLGEREVGPTPSALATFRQRRQSHPLGNYSVSR